MTEKIEAALADRWTYRRAFATWLGASAIAWIAIVNIIWTATRAVSWG